MRVAELMTPEPTLIQPEDPLEEAAWLLNREDIHELPVVSNGRLVGIITDRDIRTFLGPEVFAFDEQGEAEPELSGLTVDVAMARDVLTIEATTPVSEACRTLARERIAALPVVDSSGQLVGILSVTDVLHAAARMFELTTPRGEVVEV